MMQIRNLKWHDRDHTMIDLEIDMEGKLASRIPEGWQRFIASKNDPHEHGRLLFERAETGEFGRIAEWGI